MIRLKSDFSDSNPFRRAVKLVASKGILSLFDDVFFHLTIEDNMVISDRKLEVKIKYEKLSPESMTGRIAMLSFRAVMLSRMDFSFLDSFVPELDWFEDPIYYSRISENIGKVKEYLKNYIADYHGLKQAIKEFPDDLFHFIRDEMVKKRDAFHNFRKPLYVWVFKGADNYMYEYLDKLCSCPDIKYQLSLLSEARTDQDFFEFSKEMIQALAPYVEG